MSQLLQKIVIPPKSTSNATHIWLRFLSEIHYCGIKMTRYKEGNSRLKIAKKKKETEHGQKKGIGKIKQGRSKSTMLLMIESYVRLEKRAN